MLAQPINNDPSRRVIADVRESHLRSVEYDPLDMDESAFPKRLSHPNRFLKRSLDVFGSLVGLTFMGLMLPYIKWRIRKESPGPVFYKQDRIGMDGEIFECWKFRSMRTMRELKLDGTPEITTVGDNRIFPFGQWMRKYNIDELPQLINVLKGEMSLVGPRPYMVDECEYWTARIPNWRVRYRVKPGLTGWAQATGYRGGTLDQDHMTHRLRRDFKYVENASVWLDIKIIIRTLRQMIIKDTKAH